uniref:Uncharacterized protein n=1 Tax=Anopheles albimanus TaxID=7167 RepID=A0A182FYW4_ANOAL
MSHSSVNTLSLYQCNRCIANAISGLKLYVTKASKTVKFHYIGFMIHCSIVCERHP